MIKIWTSTFKKRFFFYLTLSLLMFFSVQLLFILSNFATPPNISTVIDTFNFGNYQMASILLDLNPDERGSLERYQVFYYDYLRDSDYLTPIEFRTGRVMRVGNMHFEVIEINDNSFSLFGQELSIIEGRNFEKIDFEYHSGVFPILLGYDFYSHNNVGDVFFAEYNGKMVKVEIIGFLQKQESFNVDVASWSNELDSYIIFPQLSNRNEVLRNSDEYWFWVDRYGGHVLVIIYNNSETIDGALNTVHTAAQEINARYHFINDRIFQEIYVRNLVRHQSEIMVRLFTITSVVLFVIVILSLGVMFKLQEKIYYTVMLMGIEKRKLLLAISLELSAFFVIFFVVLNDILIFNGTLFPLGREMLTHPAWLQYEGWPRLNIYRQIWSRNNVMLYVLLFTILLWLISLVYPFVKINKLYRKGT